MRIEGDDLIFSTGKKIYANNGIIGISPELYISGGYDNGLEEDDLTPEEREELADYVINLWGKWRMNND